MTVYSEWLRKFIVYALAVYIFVVSVVFTIQTENTVLIKATFGQTLIFGLTMLWFARLIEERKFKFMPAEFNLPLVVLTLGCVLSLALSPFKYYSLMEIAHFLSYFLSVWLIYNNVRTRFEFNVLLWSFVAATACSVIYAIMQKLGMDWIEWGMPVFISTFGNANFFSAFLMCSLPAMLGMCCAFRSVLVRIGVGFWLVLGIWCLYVAETRSAWLGFFAGIFVFICAQMLWGRLNKTLAGAIKISMLVCIVLVALFAVSQHLIYTGKLIIPADYPKLMELTSMFKVTYGTEGGTNQVRLVMWMGAAKMWAEKPLLGQSIGTFRLMFPRYRPSYYSRWGVSHNTDYPHNEYVGTAADQGMLGLLLFGWFWWTFVHSMGRGIKREQNWYWQQMMIGLLCAFVAHMGDNATSPHLRWPATAVAAYFVIGMGFVALRLAANAVPAKPRAFPLTLNYNPLKYIAYGVLTAVFCFAMFLELRVYRGELLMKQGENILNDPSSPMNADRYNAAKDYFLQSLASNPYNHSVLYKLAYINLQLTKTDAALATYQQLMAIAPHYAQIHYNVGLVYQMLGKPFESIEQFKLATRIEDNSQNQTNTGQALMASPSHDFRRAANHFPRMIDSAMFDWMKSYYQCMVRLRPGRVLLDYVGYQADAKHVGKVRYARTFSMTGTALGMDGNLKLQRYFYHRALNWHPYESEVLLRRAENARSANNLGLYAECLTSLISNTTDTELRDMIAKNNYAMALNEVGRFVNENQNNSQFWTLLAIGQMKLGDWEKAYQCAHNALVINPGNTLAQERMLEIQRQLSPAGAPAAAPQFDLEGNPLPQSLSPMPSRTAPAVNPAARRPSATGFVH